MNISSYIEFISKDQKKFLFISSIVFVNSLTLYYFISNAILSSRLNYYEKISSMLQTTENIKILGWPFNQSLLDKHDAFSKTSQTNLSIIAIPSECINTSKRSFVYASYFGCIDKISSLLNVSLIRLDDKDLFKSGKKSAGDKQLKAELVGSYNDLVIFFRYVEQIGISTRYAIVNPPAKVGKDYPMSGDNVFIQWTAQLPPSPRIPKDQKYFINHPGKVSSYNPFFTPAIIKPDSPKPKEELKQTHAPARAQVQINILSVVHGDPNSANINGTVVNLMDKFIFSPVNKNSIIILNDSDIVKNRHVFVLTEVDVDRGFVSIREMVDEHTFPESKYFIKDSGRPLEQNVPMPSYTAPE